MEQESNGVAKRKQTVFNSIIAITLIIAMVILIVGSVKMIEKSNCDKALDACLMDNNCNQEKITYCYNQGVYTDVLYVYQNRTNRSE